MKILIILCMVLPAMGREVSPYIVGGSIANIANHPHQMSLLLSGTHLCGASLISSNRAVTAAHCGGNSLSGYSLLGGTGDRTAASCATCVIRNLMGFARHPSYLEDYDVGYPNDIAVLSFPSLTYNSNLNAIDMATSSDGVFAGVTCTITGWGRTCGTCSLPINLQQASMTVLSNTVCANSWSLERINVGHICVSYSGRSMCSGDSGSPLVCSGKLAGVASWNEASCDTGYPSVYTRISYFYDWIIGQ